MKPICFYHKADLDGVCSGAIVKHFVPDVEMYGFDYGEEFPWDKVQPEHSQHVRLDLPGGRSSQSPHFSEFEKRTVYMVDVSLPPEDMKRLAQVSNLIWVDHHKSAIDSVDVTGMRGVRMVGFAGCELAWSYFTQEASDVMVPDLLKRDDTRSALVARLPEAVRLLGRYDVWDKDHPDWESKIMPFQYGMRAISGIYDPKNSVWEDLFRLPFYSGVENKDRAMGFIARALAAMLGEEVQWINVQDTALNPLRELGVFATRGGEKVSQSVCLKDLREDPSLQYHAKVGEAILRYQAEVNRRACETGAHELRIEVPMANGVAPTELEKFAREVYVKSGLAGNVEHPLRAIACNTIVFNSQFFDGFYDPTKHDVMCAYAQIVQEVDEPGSTKHQSICTGIVPPMGLTIVEYPRKRKVVRWKVSLYSTKPEIDCGAICKTFGGGGHKGAAGFICDKLPWEK